MSVSSRNEVTMAASPMMSHANVTKQLAADE